MIDLKYDDLQAFLYIYQEGTFTQAAKKYGLTQSALSQKIARVEDVLQATVFVRHPRSLELTASGEKLLIYAKEVIQRQQEFLKSFDQYNQQLNGVVRIAGFSSVMRSLVIPKLAPFMRKNPGVSIEFSSHEMFELEEILKTNKADFIITDYLPQLGGINTSQIGQEEYVIIRAKKYPDVPHLFLDHGPYDNATESYFKHVRKNRDYQRAFMGDVYSIIDAVSLGLGKAVMSKHLIENDKRFVIEKTKKSYVRPIAISYFNQGYYPPLFGKILQMLQTLS